MDKKDISKLPVERESLAKPVDIHISALTILKVVLVFFGLFLLYKLRLVVLMIFVAMILAALIDPFATWFHKHKVPRGIGVLIIYVVLFGVLATAVVLIVPPLLSELGELIRNFSGIWGSIASALINVQEFSAQYGIQENIQRGLESLQEGLARGITGMLGTIKGIFGGLASFVIVLVLTFYLVVEEDAVRRVTHKVLPKQYQPYLFGLFERMQEKIGYWLRGELILMILVGLFSYVGLLILGVDYALLLGLIAGIAEIIPYAGPVIAAVPAVILAFTQSPLKALFVVVLYFAIQQLENHLLVPKVMQKAVGLNPVISIISLLTGFQLAGVLGAVLAIPVATALSVVVHDLFSRHQTPDTRHQ